MNTKEPDLTPERIKEIQDMVDKFTKKKTRTIKTDGKRKAFRRKARQAARV